MFPQQAQQRDTGTRTGIETETGIENDVEENEISATNTRISISFILVVLAIFLFVSVKIFLTYPVKWFGALLVGTILKKGRK